jgi:transcriptional regulator with XRE-family HTH domain
VRFRQVNENERIREVAARLAAMTSGQLIREARLRAGLTQQQLADRLGRPITMVNRWERDGNEPGLSGLLRILRACGFDLALDLVPYARDGALEAELERRIRLTPAERMQELVDEGRSGDG